MFSPRARNVGADRSVPYGSTTSVARPARRSASATVSTSIRRCGAPVITSASEPMHTPTAMINTRLIGASVSVRTRRKATPTTRYMAIRCHARLMNGPEIVATAAAAVTSDAVGNALDPSHDSTTLERSRPTGNPWVRSRCTPVMTSAAMAAANAPSPRIRHCRRSASQITATGATTAVTTWTAPTRANANPSGMVRVRLNRSVETFSMESSKSQANPTSPMVTTAATTRRATSAGWRSHLGEPGPT